MKTLVWNRSPANAEDRYKFRTTPLRNVALQPALFHNGAFARLDDTARHHLDVFKSARNYDPVRAAAVGDLTLVRGPIEPVLGRIDPLLATPGSRTDQEFDWLVEFVRVGLLDRRALPEHFRKLVPKDVPSGRPALVFQFDDRLDTR